MELAGTETHENLKEAFAGESMAVQYLSFAVSAAPVAVGTDFPPLAAETVLDGTQRAALAADLDESLS